MSNHVFKSINGEDLQPWREFIRQSFPNGSGGYTPEDLDLIFRRFGPRCDEDGIGSFKLIEFKRGNQGYLGTAQQKTFGVIDRLLRSAGHPERTRYKGFYLVNWLQRGEPRTQEYHDLRAREDKLSKSLVVVKAQLAQIHRPHIHVVVNGRGMELDGFRDFLDDKVLINPLDF